MRRQGFTLIEAIVVMTILGFLTAMVAPRLSGVFGRSAAELNRAQMLKIKDAALRFYGDVGFVPDTVSLLIYPYTEHCRDAVQPVNHDKNTSRECKNLIAFLDRHYKGYADYGASNDYREDVAGDTGDGTKRKTELMDILRQKLDAKAGGWRGGYLEGGSDVLTAAKVRPYRQTGSGDDNSSYWVGDKDRRIYFEEDGSADLYGALGLLSQNELIEEWFPVFTENFGSDLDDRYAVAKYRGNRIGDPVVLDPWGTPYEIQLPLRSAEGGEVPDDRARTRYARIVSFGPDRRRQTAVDALYEGGYAADNDDSVLYLFDVNAASRFGGIE
jgi:prepilin-type N-terminal cleavage/methylation domain-containing protein